MQEGRKARIQVLFNIGREALKKRGFIILFLLLAVCAGLFAATYRIKDYDFVVNGKTKQFVLLEVTGNPGVTFDSQKTFLEFLDGKRQEFFNMRVFHEVSYTYTTQQVAPDVLDAVVTFYLHDASTFLMVPYPKYDSNYGLSIKLKAKDNNLFGTFASMDAEMEYSQQNNSFKDGLADWEISFEDIRLGKTKLSASQYGKINLVNWKETAIGIGADVSDIMLGDFVSLNGGFSFVVAPGGSSKDSSWGVKKIGADFGVSFLNEKMYNSSAKTSVSYYPMGIRPHEEYGRLLHTSSSFSYHMNYGIYNTSILSTKNYPDKFETIYSLRIGTGLSRAFSFFGKINFIPSVMVYLDHTFPTEDVDPFFEVTLPFNYSEVNWEENNFRKGLSFDLTGTDRFHFLFDNLRNYITVTGDISAYYPVTNWFNPSLRVNFVFANSLQDINSEDDYSGCMRGIRNDNETINAEREIGIAMNLDLMVNFIRINGFCSTYAIPFVDVFLGSNGQGGLDRLVTVGAEGIIILDSHPGYPIRGSLGFNAVDLVRWTKGDIDFSDVEYELFIGLYFFY